ncbi:MAG: cytochrome P450 [Myxococcota bacterium]
MDPRTPAPAPTTAPPGFAPDQAGFYLGDPHTAFRRLRAEDPVHWYEDGGFWCVLRHADVQAVSRSPRTFVSSRGTQMFQIASSGVRTNLPVDTLAPSIIQTDPPHHNRLRKLVMGAFTPRRIAEMEPRLREIAGECLDAIEPGGTVDFVETAAVPFPMLVIAEMLGISGDDRAEFRRWSDAMVVAGGGGFGDETGQAIRELFGYLTAVIAERRKAPRDDLISVLMDAEIEGERLRDAEVLMFLLTLLVAGNETTRNLVSCGALALLREPDQHRLLRTRPEWLPNAVEEMLRYVSPVRNFARCAAADTELAGRPIQAGQYVVMLYGSANRDESVFGDDSERFDVTRASARRHVAFGFGEHLCLGASLARLEGLVLWDELFARFGHLELAGEPEPLSSSLMNGLVHLPVVFQK